MDPLPPPAASPPASVQMEEKPCAADSHSEERANLPSEAIEDALTCPDASPIRLAREASFSSPAQELALATMVALPILTWEQAGLTVAALAVALSLWPVLVIRSTLRALTPCPPGHSPGPLAPVRDLLSEASSVLRAWGGPLLVGVPLVLLSALLATRLVVSLLHGSASMLVTTAIVGAVGFGLCLPAWVASRVAETLLPPSRRASLREVLGVATDSRMLRASLLGLGLWVGPCILALQGAILSQALGLPSLGAALHSLTGVLLALGAGLAAQHQFRLFLLDALLRRTHPPRLVEGQAASAAAGLREPAGAVRGGRSRGRATEDRRPSDRVRALPPPRGPCP